MTKTSSPCQSDMSEMKKQQSSTETRQTAESPQEGSDTTIDPVYHALVTANRIAQQRRQSTSQFFQPISSFGQYRTAETTPSNSSSEFLGSREHILLKKKNSLVSSSTTSSYTNSTGANSRGSPANDLPSGIKSTPNLVSQKSIDGENSDYVERPRGKF
ncbi:unnamed protein product [Soboliphyme baturini]|uniref:Uncharacterized protein n=1 Tax=Soboliphyme baturini TaxID=241478 RepID=A0A183I973_9BILA|nr:unnamed protein product [Soboliphyme baturini]